MRTMLKFTLPTTEETNARIRDGSIGQTIESIFGNLQALPPLGTGDEEKMMAKTNHLGALAAGAGALVAVGLLMLMLVVVEARPAGATFPGKNGKIAFERGYELYTINPDGTGLKQITHSPNNTEISPAYSPNAKKIAYTFGRGTLDPILDQIYTINATGVGTPFNVTKNTTLPGDTYSPSYSPNGKRIAFSSGSDIYTIPVGGGTPFNVTKNTTRDSCPSYSPDGKRIAYQGTDAPNGDYEIYTIPVGGGTPFKVTENTTDDSCPSYSPDGKKIAYKGKDGTRVDIYTIPVGGGTPFNVTKNTTNGGLSPSWGSKG
jgi:Tol biopolymer transport system component